VKCINVARASHIKSEVCVDARWHIFVITAFRTSVSETIRKPPLVKAQTTLCNVACGSGIMTVNSPSGSTLQCDTWLWDDMPLNSPKRPPYWNSTSGSDSHHITAVDMLFCTSLGDFIQIGPPSAEKNDVMSIFKMADFSHLGFYGSNNGFFEKPTFYRSSIETTALNCLVF